MKANLPSRPLPGANHAAMSSMYKGGMGTSFSRMFCRILNAAVAERQEEIMRKKSPEFNDQFKRYTTYRLPKNIKALICVLAGLLTLSVAINIYVMFAGTKKEPPRVIEITVPRTAEREGIMQSAKEPTTTTATEEATTAQYVRYYNVPLAEDLQDFIRFCLDNDDIHEDISLPLILAIIEVESDYRADIISETNDYGLMQINECNHEWLAEQHHLTDMFDPYQNIEAGIIILNDCMKNSPNMHGALTAYNRGLSGANELWEQGIYETAYSRKVMDTFERIRRAK